MEDSAKHLQKPSYVPLKWESVVENGYKRKKEVEKGYEGRRNGGGSMAQLIA